MWLRSWSRGRVPAAPAGAGAGSAAGGAAALAVAALAAFAFGAILATALMARVQVHCHYHAIMQLGASVAPGAVHLYLPLARASPFSSLKVVMMLVLLNLLMTEVELVLLLTMVG